MREGGGSSDFPPNLPDPYFWISCLRTPTGFGTVRARTLTLKKKRNFGGGNFWRENINKEFWWENTKIERFALSFSIFFVTRTTLSRRRLLNQFLLSIFIKHLYHRIIQSSHIICQGFRSTVVNIKIYEHRVIDFFDLNAIVFILNTPVAAELLARNNILTIRVARDCLLLAVSCVHPEPMV